ncbi:unnamed protein product, partial [marine sediment metagenome]
MAGPWIYAALALLPGCRAERADTDSSRAASALERTVKMPWAAGKFYPAEADAVRKVVESCLDEANLPSIDGRIIALLAPHAGYQYSGRVAGMAFAPV